MRLGYMVVTPEVERFPFAWVGPAAEVLPAIADLGYEGVEIQTCDPKAFDRDAFRAQLDSHKLQPVVLSSGPVGRQDGLYLVHEDAEVRTRALDRFHSILDLAADWGCDMAIGRGRGMLSAAPSREIGLEWLRGGLDELLEHAAARDIRLQVEPQNRYNTDSLLTVDETLSFIIDVGSDRLLIEADTYHMALEERSITAALVRASGHLGNVQLADTNRLAPGRGFLPWVDILETLRAVGYEGWLTVEIDQQPTSATAARQSIDLVRALL